MVILSRLQLAVYISDSVPAMLIGDPGRFRQIITNLIGNSIKASNAFFCTAKKLVGLSGLGGGGGGNRIRI